MHIADGILNVPTSVVTGVAAAGVLALAVRKTKQELDEKQVPLLGVTAAFIFAAQMINFPVLPGTSGHLMGGVLAAILLGPWAAAIVIATVLAIQAFFFGDGGIIVLGASIFNMAVVATFGGYYIFRLMEKINPSIAIFVGAWAGVVLSAIAVAIEISLSRVLPLTGLFTALVGVHILIGLGEGLITLAVITYLKKIGARFGT